MPALTIFGALVLAVIPLPGVVSPFRPDWVAVALLYWTLIQPRRYGGQEMGWDVLCEVTEILAAACGSQAWIVQPGVSSAG